MKMDWKHRLQGFLDNNTQKTVFFINIKRDLESFVDYLTGILDGSKFEHSIVFFGVEVPHCLERAHELKVTASEDCLNKDEYEAIDEFIFKGISATWYRNNNVTDYKQIPLGKMLEYDFQKFLTPRIKNIHLIKRIVEQENPGKIIAIDDGNELLDACNSYEKDILKVSLASDTNVPNSFKTVILGLLRQVLDSISSRRAIKRMSKSNSVLMDEKLSKVLGNVSDRLFILLDKGIKKRLALWRNKIPYIPFFASKSKKYFREWKPYIEKWSSLKSQDEFKSLFKYEDISIWEMVSERLHIYFCENIPIIISNINRIHDIFSKNAKLVVLRNDVKELERTIIFGSRVLKIPSLVIQHGILAESNGHSNLIADKFAAWGSASKDWYREFGNPDENIEVTGNPKFDQMIGWTPAISKEDMCRQLGLEVDKSIILFATQQINKFSSFWTDDLFWVMAREILTHIQSEDNVQLVIKVDPYEDIAPYRELISRVSSNNTKVVKDFDIYTLMYHSNAVITLDSTVGIESMLFRKPLITFRLIERNARVPYAEKGAAIEVNKAQDLNSTLKEVLNETPTRSQVIDAQSRFLDEYAYKRDGRATERVKNLINKYSTN